MLSLHEWAARWLVPEAALRELVDVAVLEPVAPQKPGSEAAVQACVRLEAARAGVYLWRNNRGAFKDDTGRVIRFGLANDSKALGDKLKSHDLVGWRSRLIHPLDVGQRIAQTYSRECKPVGWKFNPNDAREAAQMRWHLMVQAAGGDSAFVTGEGSFSHGQ